MQPLSNCKDCKKIWIHKKWIKFFKTPPFKLVPLFKLPGYIPPFPFFTSDSRVFHIVLMGGREIPHPVGGNGKICWGDFFIGCWDIEEWFWPFKLFSKLKYKRFSKPKYTELPGVLPLAAPFPPAGSTGGAYSALQTPCWFLHVFGIRKGLWPFVNSIWNTKVVVWQSAWKKPWRALPHQPQ